MKIARTSVPVALVTHAISTGGSASYTRMLWRMCKPVSTINKIMKMTKMTEMITKMRKTKRS